MSRRARLMASSRGGGGGKRGRGNGGNYVAPQPPPWIIPEGTHMSPGVNNPFMVATQPPDMFNIPDYQVYDLPYLNPVTAHELYTNRDAEIQRGRLNWLTAIGLENALADAGTRGDRQRFDNYSRIREANAQRGGMNYNRLQDGIRRQTVNNWSPRALAASTRFTEGANPYILSQSFRPGYNQAGDTGTFNPDMDISGYLYGRRLSKKKRKSRKRRSRRKRKSRTKRKSRKK